MKRQLLDKPLRQMKTHFMPFPHESPRAETTEDGSEIHKFRFAFPKGTLDARMNHRDSRICGGPNCTEKVNSQIPFYVAAHDRVIGFCSESCRMRFENKDAREDQGKTDARMYDG